ncbi:MAG: AAA family ATPase [Egibacteraceae bacterium]
MNARDLAWAMAYQTMALEGCDGAGKTTLATRLAAAHGFVVIHSGRTPDDVDLVGRYRALLARSGRIVLDRCFLSELVYGPLYRGRSRIDQSETVALVAEVASRHGVFVHVTAPVTTIQARLAARADGEVPALSVLEEIIKRYEHVVASVAGHAPVLRVDTTQLPLPEVPR